MSEGLMLGRPVDLPGVSVRVCVSICVSCAHVWMCAVVHAACPYVRELTPQSM